MLRFSTNYFSCLAVFKMRVVGARESRQGVGVVAQQANHSKERNPQQQFKNRLTLLESQSFSYTRFLRCVHFTV